MEVESEPRNCSKLREEELALVLPPVELALALPPVEVVAEVVAGVAVADYQ